MDVNVEIDGNVYKATISTDRADMCFVLSIPGLSQKIQGDDLRSLALSIPNNISVFPRVTF